MAFQLSPGVNVTERDLTTIVPAVSTTNAAFAGLFNWGPVGKIILVDSENSLVKTFGVPDDINYEYFFSAANFLSYGNNLSVVRTVRTSTSAKNATPGGLATTFVANEDRVGDLNGNTYGFFMARYPGSLGNSLEIQTCGASAAAFDAWEYGNQFDTHPTTTSSVLGQGGSGDAFHLVVIDKGGLWSGATGTVLERYDNLSLYSGAYDANGASKFFRNRINDDSDYILCPTSPVITTTATALGITAGATASSFTTTFTNFSYGGKNGTYVPFGVVKYTLSGGVSETAVTTAPQYLDVAFGGGGGASGGYQLFKDSDTVDVNLIIGGPEAKPSGTAVASGTVAKKIKDDIADVRKDCVLFCSSPINNPTRTDNDKKDIAISYRNDIGSSSYVFIDSGYKYMYDIYNDKYRWVPLCGDIAGICARSDSTNDPWYSPAGFNRGQVKGVVKLAFNPSSTFRDTLYKNNINPVVTLPGEGTILYGDKTALTRPSAFDRINVRRLFIVLEKAIATAAKYSLFEFNDTFTRAQFRSLVEPFLRDVQARRGITDFKVVCDEKNNTPDVIDSNRFIADIYIKPARSINFIQLNFVATRTGVSFSEVGA